MKHLVFVIPALVGALLLAGCGGEDRSALAHRTVATYWSDVSTGKLGQSYNLLSSGDQSSIAFSDYQKNMFGFLTSVGTIRAVVGKPTVKDDHAVVPVTLTAPQEVPRHACQHLFWEGGHWRITDANGGLSPTPCTV